MKDILWVTSNMSHPSTVALFRYVCQRHNVHLYHINCHHAGVNPTTIQMKDFKLIYSDYKHHRTIIRNHLDEGYIVFMDFMRLYQRDVSRAVTPDDNVILRQHDDLFHKPEHLDVEWHNFRRIVVNAKAYALDFERRFGRKVEYNPAPAPILDTGQITKRKWSARLLTLTSDNAHRKGIDDLILMRPSDATLTIAGELKGEYYLPQTNPANVRIIGKVRDTRRLYEEHDVYICNSKRESFCCALHESIVAGCYPISSRWFGIDEFFNHEFTYENPREFVEIYNFVKTLSDDDRFAVVEKERERILRRYTLENVYAGIFG